MRMCEECVHHRPDYTFGKRMPQWDTCTSPKVERERERKHADFHEREDRAMASVVTYPPTREKDRIFCKNERMDWRTATGCGPAGEFFEPAEPEVLARKYRFGWWKYATWLERFLFGALFAVIVLYLVTMAHATLADGGCAMT